MSGEISYLWQGEVIDVSRFLRVRALAHAGHDNIRICRQRSHSGGIHCAGVLGVHSHSWVVAHRAGKETVVPNPASTATVRTDYIQH